MKELSRTTKAYLFAVIIIGTLILTRSLLSMEFRQLGLFLALCVAGSLAAIFKVEGATNRSHYTIDFLVYGFALASLGAPAAIIVIAVANFVAWFWKRVPWFIQAFNTTCYIVVMYLASLIYFEVNPGGELDTWRAIVAITACMAAFTLLNHFMVGLIVWLARGEDFRRSGVFDFLPLIIDMTLLSLGGSMVILWQHNPFTLALFSLPLYLIYSTLRVPALERQTEIDSKTGLFNHGYFMQQLEAELNRANRFDRPLAVIMADLDLLRNINNTYGHLAGDEVLIHIASILKQAVREYDIVSRFGGEEFALMLPETTMEQAFERAEMIRQTIERAAFIISTSVTPINVTVSIGIAGRERFDQPGPEIIHNADTALYHSKLKGRNRTYVCADQAYASLLPDQVTAPAQTLTPEGGPGAVTHENYRAAEAVRVPRQAPAPKPASAKEAPAPAAAARKPKAKREGNAKSVDFYIGGVMLLAAVCFGGVLLLSPIRLESNSGWDWLGLASIAVLVVLTEWFSIELYVQHTTVSTSAVPMLAGTLLFGPLGALVVSAAFAVTALFKYRSPFSRLCFNFGNQLIAAMIYTALITLTGRGYMGWDVPMQVVLCLTAAFLVYLVTTALVAVGVSLDLQQPALQVWKEQYGWLATSYLGMGFIAYALIFGYHYDHLLGMGLMVVPLLMIRVSQKQYVDRTRMMVTELHEKQRTLERSSEEIRALNNGLLNTLAEIIDMSDPYVLGHSTRVADLATRIARRLGLHEKQIDLIRNASVLHDIGKLGVSSAVLGKPSKLSSDEYECVKKHVAMGTALLEKTPSLRALAPIIGGHHEHFDGKGYPHGLQGAAIPLEARIIAASDAIETMASDRPYRKAMPVDGIIEELERCSGTQFDPLVVEAAIQLLAARAEPPAETAAANAAPQTTFALVNGA